MKFFILLKTIINYKILKQLDTFMKKNIILKKVCFLKQWGSKIFQNNDRTKMSIKENVFNGLMKEPCFCWFSNLGYSYGL